ncbi:MAG: 16S rRNA (guanine(966)-N(2))-methyltransferase RsmD [Candidatus Omnitrophica bacterium]|nr:16S rRNA (guanine(966)-N(2))-methyltransferase RsmD [Candidatus Omnitrophota bacterium]MCM8793271.1 16S rRNA (guanine(966)-N(2))-methyltransferase RsmD [Candidatus Omnitrophota bacterium]
MRITTGILKGKKLVSPRLKKIRLTEEKVRKAIFDVLGSFVKGAKVLELFAGSGALGVEAISRGAEKVVFVDNHIACIEAIRKNIPREFKTRTEIIKADCLKTIKYLAEKKEKFDLLILDPPYKKGWVSLTLKKLSENSILLNPEAMIVVEHHCTEELDLSGIKNLFFLKQKKYAETLVSFLRFGR